MKVEWSVFAVSVVLAICLVSFGGRISSFWLQRDALTSSPITQAKPALDWSGVDAFLAHRATYAIKTTAVKSGSHVTNASGTLVYEWRPECNGFATSYHFDMRYEYSDARPIEIKSYIAGFEHKDQPVLDFVTKRFIGNNSEPAELSRGHANFVTGKVVFDAPEGRDGTQLNGALFPTYHTLALLKAVQSGERFMAANLFDGADDGLPVFVSAYVGPDVVALDDGQYDGKAVDVTALQVPGHAVRMAFYPEQGDQEVPDYEMSVIFHENGVMRNMNIEYDTFSVSQTLQSLEILKNGCP